MRAAIEDHGAIQEELRSAHEEMLSSNEEFQSTNEELETSKEELQATNEELTTTIDELRNRNQQLAVVNAALDGARRASESALSYSDIIIETVREPLAVLDGRCKFLRVNPAFAAHLQILVRNRRPQPPRSGRRAMEHSGIAPQIAGASDR
jgi:two-component system CheB/CheR fusion protein